MSKFCIETADSAVKAAYNMTIAALGESARTGIPKIINIDQIVNARSEDSTLVHDWSNDQQLPIQTRIFCHSLALFRQVESFFKQYKESVKDITPNIADDLIKAVFCRQPIRHSEEIREECSAVIRAFVSQLEESVA